MWDGRKGKAQSSSLSGRDQFTFGHKEEFALSTIEEPYQIQGQLFLIKNQISFQDNDNAYF